MSKTFVVSDITEYYTKNEHGDKWLYLKANNFFKLNISKSFYDQLNSLCIDYIDVIFTKEDKTSITHIQAYIPTTTHNTHAYSGIGTEYTEISFIDFISNCI